MKLQEYLPFVNTIVPVTLPDLHSPPACFLPVMVTADAGTAVA